MTNDIPVSQIEDNGIDYVLRCVQGIYKGMFIYINLNENGEIIGSSQQDCSLCIDDANLAPKHLQIKMAYNEDLKKQDYNLKPLAPTWFKIRYDCPAMIFDGMEVKIGKLDYKFQIQVEDFKEITEWLNLHDLQQFKNLFEPQMTSLKSVKSHKIEQYLPILQQYNATEEQIQKFKEAYEDINNILLHHYDNFKINVIRPQTNESVLSFGWAGITISSRTQTYQKPPDILIKKTEIEDLEELTDFELVIKFYKGKYWIWSSKSDNYNVYYKLREDVKLQPDDIIKIQDIVLQVQRFHIGYYADIGTRRQMEDGVSIIQDLQVSAYIPVSCYAIFDGHNGQQCVQYIQMNLIDTIREWIGSREFDSVPNFFGFLYETIRAAFKETDSNFYSEIQEQNTGGKSGCVCVLILIIGDYLISANCGDSRAILSRNGQAVALTEDHKAYNPSEKQRILKKGGQIDGGRIGQLAVTRAFGDFQYKAQGMWKKNIITAKPEIRYHLIDYGKDEFVVLCSDGIIDGFRQNQEVVDFIRNYYLKSSIGDQDPYEAAKLVVQEAYNNSIQYKKSSDNQSCMIINLSRAIQLIRTYNPIIMSPDSHFEEFVQENCKKMFDTEVMFLKQVFSGVMRYEEFLKILTKTMFQILSGSTNRNDGTLYQIFSYLIIFRLDELPYNEFKKMVNEQDPVKMNVLLGFLFNIQDIQKHLTPQWNDIYDPQYIQETVIGGLEQHFPMMKDLLSYLSSRATDKKSDLVDDEERPPSAAKKQPTLPKPFKLSETKKKIIQETPPKIEQIKSKPVPKNLNKKTLAQIEEENKKRFEQSKQKVAEIYKEAKPFDFKTDSRPNNYETVKKEMEDKLSRELQFNKKHSRPMPNNLEQAEVKLNAAAILREEMLLKKVQQIEQERVKNLEVNLRDSGEFEEWQKQQQEKEEIERLEHQQQKKIEMELAREAAMRAQEEKFKENRQLAEQMKKEAVERLKERQELQQEQVEHRKQLIEQITEAEKKVYLQVEKVQEKNKQMAEEQKLEMARKLELKRQEDEQIRIKREELIKQIRELERQPIKRTKGYDPTETMGYGLLEEMSLAQLRERLDQIKEERKAVEVEKRKEIVIQKDEYLNSMQRKVQDIKQHRQSQSQQKNMEREAKKLKKQKEEELKKKIREEQLIQVQSKISNKKTVKNAEEQRIAAEVRETKLRQQYMNANKAMVEEKAWKSQQDGLEREIKFRQNDKLISQEGIESVKLRERKILAEQAKRLVKEKVDFNANYDVELRTAYQMNDELNKEELENRTMMHNIQKTWQQEHTQNMIARDEFKQKMAETQLRNSKSKKQQQQQESKLLKTPELPQPSY